MTRRRDFLLQGLSCGASVCGLGPSGCASPNPAPASFDCTSPNGGSSPTHCLVVPELVRVKGAATLMPGDALLMSVDDNTAVIVARDNAGFHALSGICTHACCIVSLCGDASCSELTLTPGACSSTRITQGNPDGESILCPCHGATFRLSDGVALSGPTSTALPAYAMSIDGSDLVVDTGSPVAASLRVG